MKCIVCGASRYRTGAAFITSGVAFHHFPKNEDRAKEWLRCIGKPLNFPIAHADTVCSKHFRDSDYSTLPTVTDDQDSTEKGFTKAMLKLTALPTLDEVFERSLSAKRPRSPNEEEQLTARFN